MNSMYKPLFLEPKYISKYSALIRNFFINIFIMKVKLK